MCEHQRHRFIRSATHVECGHLHALLPFIRMLKGDEPSGCGVLVRTAIESGAASATGHDTTVCKQLHRGATMTLHWVSTFPRREGQGVLEYPLAREGGRHGGIGAVAVVSHHNAVEMLSERARRSTERKEERRKADEVLDRYCSTTTTGGARGCLTHFRQSHEVMLPLRSVA